MTDPAQPVEATPEMTRKLVETAHEVAAYLESYAADGWQQVPNAGTLMHRLATELSQSATSLSLAQTEIAGHIRIEDDLKMDIEALKKELEELKNVASR